MRALVGILLMATAAAMGQQRGSEKQGARAAVVLEQIDKPAEGLIERGNAAQRDNRKKLAEIEGARGIVHRTVPAACPDLESQLPFIQLDIMTCLANGDYHRAVAKLCRDAADSAAQVARELRSPAGGQAESHAAPAAAETKKQLDQVRRRVADLRAKSPRTAVEESELQAFESLAKQLQGALEIYDVIGSRTGGDNSAAVARMEEKEEQLRAKAEETDGYVAIFNLQCQYNRDLLVKIDQGAREKRARMIYDTVIGGGAPVRLAPPGGTDRDTLRKLKEDERILADPSELKKRLDHLNEISNPSGSN